MASYPGVYRAKAVSLNGTKLTAYIPQVFGDTSVVIEDYVGQLGPTGMGWVVFHGGNCEMPVWLGAENHDDRYVNTDGDEMTGQLTILRTDSDPNLRTNKTGAANADGAIHIEILSAGTQIGRITRATSTTAGFLTTSDEDLKENIVSIDDELAFLWMRTIEPYFFNYKGVPDVRHVGYSAQRVAQQWPNGVRNGIITPGWGAASNRLWDEDGNEITPRSAWQPWMMDHAKITPILHAGMLAMDRIQTQRTVLLAQHAQRIAALEVAVDDLETLTATQAAQISALQQLTATHTAQISTLLQTTSAQAQQIATLQQGHADQQALINTNSQEMNENSQAIGQLRVDTFYTRRFVAYWQWSNTLTAPPGPGQMRTSADGKTMWLHKIDTDGYDRAAQFTMFVAGVEIAVRSTAGRTATFRSNATPVDSGAYYTVPVTLVSGTTADRGVRVEITIRTGIWASDSPPVIAALPAEYGGIDE